MRLYRAAQPTRTDFNPLLSSFYRLSPIIYMIDIVENEKYIHKIRAIIMERLEITALTSFYPYLSDDFKRFL